MEGWLVFAAVIGTFWLVGWVVGLYKDKKKSEERINDLYRNNLELQQAVNEWKAYSDSLQEQESQLTKKEALFKRLFQERTKNYPVVGQIWSDLIKITDEEREKALTYKKRPALRAAEQIKATKQEKRELAKELIYWKYKSQNYEAIYPWLAEELEQDIKDEVEEQVYYTVYTEKEREDPVSQFVSPEDFRKLSSSQRNQLALNRYWTRGKKSKWMIGKMYERYVGYLYEQDGWDVEYFGIHKRFEDLGRDLIARKGKEIHVIQCKNWSRFKTIYENHVFQLFGTSFSFQKDHKDKKVVPVFYCSTSLSETAIEFAKRLGIKVYQNHSFREYPCIKCNISPNGERIYHLPFDQQYDKVKIIPKTGELYAKSIEEAESKGFRRAFRWSGNKSA